MIVDPGTSARSVRKRRARDLDPGSKVATKPVEYGDEFAVAVRAILRPKAEPVEPEPVVVDDAWAEAVRRTGGLIENGHVGGNPMTGTP